MNRFGSATFDLRDDREKEIREDTAGSSNVETWPNTNQTSRLIQEYELAQRENGDDPQLHLNFGRAALEQGLESHAVEALTTYTRLKADDPEGHYYLGAAYSCKGAHKEAALAYEQALKLYPDDADVLMALHFAYFCLLRFKDAIRCIEQVERIVGRERKEKLNVKLFGVWKGINLLLDGRDDDEVEQLLMPGVSFEGIIGQAAHFGLALLALKHESQRKLEPHRSYLESVGSPLLPALSHAASRGSVEAREAVHALTGKCGRSHLEIRGRKR